MVAALAVCVVEVVTLRLLPAEVPHAEHLVQAAVLCAPAAAAAAGQSRAAW